MTLWLSGQFSKFGLAFLWELRDNGVMKTLQFLSLKPRSRIRILLHRLVYTGKIGFGQRFWCPQSNGFWLNLYSKWQFVLLGDLFEMHRLRSYWAYYLGLSTRIYILPGET